MIYKDEYPDKTVKKIENILSKIPLNVEIIYEQIEFNQFYTIRIVVQNTNIGVNGKGVSRVIALASAYGELMERLQNKALLGWESSGFNFKFYPDEYIISYSDLISRNNPILQKITSENNLINSPILKDSEYLFNRIGRDKILCYKTYELNTGREYDFPLALHEAYGTNGMAAGNTFEEAAVQSISEIFERYSCITLLKGMYNST